MWSTTLNLVLKWLRPIVGLLAVVLSIGRGQGQTIRPAERQALIDLYNSTNGPNWANRTNWLTDSSPCGWDGVTCKNGSITYLTLPYNNLTGTLPTSLSALTYLERLDLYHNQLSGEIPASLGTLTYLERLDLNNNQLSGSIPSSLSALTRLTRLSLHDNQLSGCIPASLSALCHPTVTVNLSGNPGLPGGGDFTAFCVSGLGSDDFQPIARAQPNPAVVGQSVSLSVTAGSAYRWSGPDGFTASAQSPTLSLSSVTQSGLYSVNVTDRSAGCEATASVSLTVNSPSAEYQALVDLYNSTNGPNWTNNTNWLTGSSPCGWYGVGCFNGQIVGLDLSRNQLSGPIPASLGALTNLGQLILNNNQLSGSIPSSLSALLHLELLNLNENQLSGCLPAGLSVFCGKEILLFRNPGLPGGGNFRAFCQSGLGSDQPIAMVQPSSASLGQSVSLSVTAGSAYRWSGPDGFTASVQSPTLSLSSVSQGGLYSVTVTNGSSSCEATASVSLTVDTRADVQALIDLYNSTDGPNWANNTNWLKDGNTCGWYGVTCVNDQITRLDLDNNQLKGTLPASLSALTNLQHLGLYNNQLSGPIMDGISALTQLQWLDLGQNQLSGEIPASLSTLTNLLVFSLARNAQISGAIPSALSALTQLQRLHLDGNQLSGVIPSGLSALTNLQILALNNNQLSGCLPSSLTALCGKTVDLSNNPGLPGGGDFAAFCQSGAGSGMPPWLTASDTTTTNQPISVTASGCSGTLNWNVVGGMGSASGSVYTLTQPGAYTLSASCSLNTCTSLPSPSLSLLINPPVPDLTPVLYLRPTVTYGITDMTLVVDVVEINGVATSGPIKVYVSRNSQMPFSFDASQSRVGGRNVQNGSWQFSSNGSYYILTSSNSIAAGDVLSFGLSGQLNPGSTEGRLSGSVVIAAGSGGETNLRNNGDANKLDYFQQ